MSEIDGQITFVKTRHQYDSYLDFWKLVELSGFPTIYVDELDVSSLGVFIVCPMNGEWRPHVDNQSDKIRNAHLVLWNLERPAGSSGSVGQYGESNRELIYNRYVDEVWVSDRRLAEETELRYVTLGSDKGLGKPSKIKNYDFCHMSYEVPRRQTIYKHFGQHQIGYNCWPPERDRILQSSRFAVNVHQDNHPFQEPLRFALFAAWGLPIISETIYDPFPWTTDEMFFCSFDTMVLQIRNALGQRYHKWEQMGLKARSKMTGKYRFKTMVEVAIKQSVNSWR